MKVATHHLRCTECGAVITGSAVNSIFRCPDCNGLYDVIYPWSPASSEPPESPGSAHTSVRMSPLTVPSA